MNSKKKGDQYERDCCNWLNKVFEDVFPSMTVGIKSKIAHRTPGSGGFSTRTGIDKFSGDALTTIKIGDRKVKFDFKFYKRLGIFSFWNKHRKETLLDDIPVLIIHSNNERDHLIVMERNDWAELVRRGK